MFNNADSAARRRKLKSRGSFILLAASALVLTLIVIGSAVWRAFPTEEFPPTPTIPAAVEPSFAYVSDVAGRSESYTGSSVEVNRLQVGDMIPAGPDTTVRVAPNGWLRLGFVNGATLFLDAQTEVGLREIADPTKDITRTVVLIREGQLLAAPGPNEALSLVVRAGTGAEARASDGLFGVRYEVTIDRFSLDCLRGNCFLVGNGNELKRIPAGEYSSVQGSNSPLTGQPARYEIFQGLGDPGLVPSATPVRAVANSSPTPSPTRHAPATETATRPSPTPLASATPIDTATPRASATIPTPALRLGIGPGVPGALVDAIEQQAAQRPSAFTVVDGGESDLRLVLGEGRHLATWVYAAAAPFYSLANSVPLGALQAAWETETGSNARSTLIVDEDTAVTLEELWGLPGDGVEVVPASSMAEQVWDEETLAILPFEQLQPQLKVLTVDGQSPLQEEFDPTSYPLTATIGLLGNSEAIAQFLGGWSGATSNRNEEHVTRIGITGPSRLVGPLGGFVDRHGISYPAQGVVPLLPSLDIASLRNDVPFLPDCPTAWSVEASALCAPVEYVAIMNLLGADVNEMTGPHVNDWGPDNLQQTLERYEAEGVATFGAGHDLGGAGEPLLMEHHGNRIAFVGCNQAGPPEAWAREDAAGARPCEQDYASLRRQIQELRQQGYFVIASVYYREGRERRPYEPVPSMAADFDLLAQAGASIISGSQGGRPLGFSFASSGAFIHYGLGNLFADAGPTTRMQRNFIDIYTVYEGRLLNVSLWTGETGEDGGPQPLTAAERIRFLEAIFKSSGW